MGKRNIFHVGSVHWHLFGADYKVYSTEVVARTGNKLVICYHYEGMECSRKVRLKDYIRGCRAAKQSRDIDMKAERKGRNDSIS